MSPRQHGPALCSGSLGVRESVTVELVLKVDPAATGTITTRGETVYENDPNGANNDYGADRSGHAAARGPGGHGQRVHVVHRTGRDRQLRDPAREQRARHGLLPADHRSRAGADDDAGPPVLVRLGLRDRPQQRVVLLDRDAGGRRRRRVLLLRTRERSRHGLDHVQRDGDVVERRSRPRQQHGDWPSRRSPTAQTSASR